MSDESSSAADLPRKKTPAQKRREALARANKRVANDLRIEYADPTEFGMAPIVYRDEMNAIALAALEVTDLKKLVGLLRYVAQRFVLVGNYLFWLEQEASDARTCLLPPILKWSEKPISQLEGS